MLDTQQVDSFKTRGFLAGLPVWTTDEVAEIRQVIETLLATPGPAGEPGAHRHLDDELTRRLCTHPAILDAVRSILGPDILLWHSRYFDKPHGGEEIPWHQDAPFWNIAPKIAVSAWLALDPVDTTNGCIHVLPASHKGAISHVKSTGGGRFGIEADPALVRESGSIPICLRAGEILLFDRYLLHRSGRNFSQKPRLALCSRFTIPSVKVSVGSLRPAVPGYGVLLVSGRDRFGLNPLIM